MMFRRLSGTDTAARAVPRARPSARPNLEALTDLILPGDTLGGYLVTGLIGLMPARDPLANAIGILAAADGSSGAEGLSLVEGVQNSSPFSLGLLSDSDGNSKMSTWR